MAKVKASVSSKPGTASKTKRSPKILKKISKPPKVKLASKAVKTALKNDVLKKEVIPKTLNEVKNLNEKPNSPRKLKKIQKKLAKVAPQKVQQGESINVDNLLNKETVESAVSALFKLNDQKNTKNELFDSEQPIFIQISTIKVPNCKPQILRLSLPNSTLTDDSEVCLITQNLKDDFKNYDKNIEKYEELLKNKGVTGINKIIPIHQLHSEYSMYEMQNRLVELYDHFLVDAKTASKAVKTFGGILNRKNKSPTFVKLNVTNLKGLIESKLKMVQFNIHPNGDNFTVKVGHMKMEEDKIVENIFGLVEELNKKFPGGFGNVKGLHIKNPLGTTIPVYVNLIKNSAVKVPIVKPDRPKAFREVTDELSTVNDCTVTVLPTGTVLLNQEKEDIESFNKRNKKRLEQLSHEERQMVSKLKKKGIISAGLDKRKNMKKKKGKGKRVIAEKIAEGVRNVAKEGKGNNNRKIEGDKGKVVEKKLKKGGEKVVVEVDKDKVKEKEGQGKLQKEVEEKKVENQVEKNVVVEVGRKKGEIKLKKGKVGEEKVEDKKVQKQGKKVNVQNKKVEIKEKKAELQKKNVKKVINKKAKLEEKMQQKKATLEEKVMKGKKIKKLDNAQVKSKTEVTNMKKAGNSKKVK